MTNQIKNKTILITGGTGSFGQAFTARLLQYKPKKIIIYSRDEFKQTEMHKAFNNNIIRYFIGDVRDLDRLKRACNGVDIIIHAAALKHVPVCEYNPIEAIQTNINGAINVINAAIDCKVKNVVALSTDKAVNPINLYGATKLCSDKLFVNANAYSPKTTKFAIVRYGNVANSRGSILPFFKDLVSKGEKILPLTDESMTRFHITLDQGIDLVFHALNKMNGGEIFISKIPSFYVKKLIESLGCKSKIIGIRPGEKLHEIMITKEDAPNTYEYKDHYIIYPQFDWYNKKRITNGTKVNNNFSYASNTNGSWLKL